MTYPLFTDALRQLLRPVRRSVFVSYHHHGDQTYYDAFSKLFHDTYECIRDNSLERACDSDNCDYVYQRIRDNYITGTSVTVVLIGWATRWRKFVDWEIKATLDKQHGLIGIKLPTAQHDSLGRFHKPDRFQDNFDSGFAVLDSWENLNVTRLNSLIETAIARPKTFIVNNRAMRARNG